MWYEEETGKTLAYWYMSEFSYANILWLQQCLWVFNEFLESPFQLDGICCIIEVCYERQSIREAKK